MENKGGNSNLNESVLPLLEDEINKEKIELKDHSSKDSSETDDADEKDKNTMADSEAAKKKKEEEKERKKQKKLEEEERKKQLKLEKQKKKDEEKEIKKQKKAEKKAAMDAAKANGGVSGIGSGKNWNRLNQFTVGINLLDRDEKSINDHVNVSFEDVIGEPDATQGFEGAYQLSFGLFQFVRFWLYRILMAIIALPLALFWALIFAILSLFSVWIITPGFRVMDIFFYFVHRVWSCLVRTFLDPIFSSIALLKRDDIKPFHQTPLATSSGRSSVYKDGVKYDKVNSNETPETYKSSNDQDSTQEQVTVIIEN